MMGTFLVVLGTGARIGLGPGAASYGWQAAPDRAESVAGGTGTPTVEENAASPAGAGTIPATAVDGIRAAVDQNVERARRAARPLAPGERLDPNEASAVELQRLAGVGPARARALIRERTEGGPFTTLEDLARVPGIGPVTLEKLAPHVSLTRRPTVSPRRGGRRARSPGEGPEASRAGRPGDRIDVNRASARLLQELPGVGPVVAERILRSRARSGRFESPEDLLRVPGIGPARLEGLRDRIVVR